MEIDPFTASVLILIAKLEPGDRLVISRVPIGDTYDDHLKMEPIPRSQIARLQAIVRRQRNGK
jgi:hypothetical protein